MIEQDKRGPSKQEEVVEEEQEAVESAMKASEQPPEDFRKKAEDYWDQIVRLQADFANYRKRTEKEKIDAIRFGRLAILEKMITLTDVMEEAIKHSRNATDMDSFRKGFEMVSQEFLRFIKSEGAEPLKTIGERFDPHLHEAIEQVPAEKEADNGLIVEEVQKGYAINGTLIRPAKVKVAKFKQK